MAQPNAGTGSKTETVKLNGETYQVRLVPCGKSDQCQTCQNDGGHPAVYKQNAEWKAKGLPRWEYVGAKLPDADPNYEAPTCMGPDCDNPLPTNHGKRKFCSTRCRQRYHRAQKSA